VFAYYDPDADIAWLPTGESGDVVSERVPHGLHNFDRASRQLVAIEIWAASTRLPVSILSALPRPSVTPTDTSWKAIQQRLGTRSATKEEWENFIREHGPDMLPPDGEG